MRDNLDIQAAESDKRRKTSTLKAVFDKYADETITDERIRKVLTPVIRMIHEGKFDSSIMQRLKRAIRPFEFVMIVAARLRM